MPNNDRAEELARSREKWVEIAKNLLWDSVVLQPAIMDFDEVVAQMADYMQSGYAALLRSRMAERWIPVSEQEHPAESEETHVRPTVFTRSDVLGQLGGRKSGE